MKVLPSSNGNMSFQSKLAPTLTGKANCWKELAIGCNENFRSASEFRECLRKIRNNGESSIISLTKEQGKNSTDYFIKLFDNKEALKNDKTRTGHFIKLEHSNNKPDTFIEKAGKHISMITANNPFEVLLYVLERTLNNNSTEYKQVFGNKVV